MKFLHLNVFAKFIYILNIYNYLYIFIFIFKIKKYIIIFNNYIYI